MLQRPDADGPPSLGDMSKLSGKQSASQGEDLVLSTGRLRLTADEAKLGELLGAKVDELLQKLEGESETILIHVTYTPDLDVNQIQKVLSSYGESPGQYIVMGRSVVKEGGTDKTIEILIISGGDSITASVGRSIDNEEDSISNAIKQIDHDGGITFGIFHTSGNVSE